MTIYRDIETPAICKRVECPDYKAFELYLYEDVKEDENRKDYVICGGCGERIYLDD